METMMASGALGGVGQRIRELRQAQNLTLEAFAERLTTIRGEAVHFTTIAKIERSQRAASLEWIWDIAKALDVPVSDILPIGPTRPIREIPLLGKIAAGNWREAIEDATASVPIPEGEVGPNAFALEPDGDSMNLAFKGSYVVVDPDQPDLLDGKLYAVMNGQGETTFKRFRTNPMRLEPMSDNPEHQPIPLGREPFTVIGRIVMEIRRY